jgi:hypothetical protein
MTNKKKYIKKDNEPKRSLGLTMIFAGSDLSGFKKPINNKNDVFGNTKIILKDDNNSK